MDTGMVQLVIVQIKKLPKYLEARGDSCRGMMAVLLRRQHRQQRTLVAETAGHSTHVAGSVSSLQLRCEYTARRRMHRQQLK
jgi:hypothetical protein